MHCRSCKGCTEEDEVTSLNLVLFGLEEQLKQLIPSLLTFLPPNLRDITWESLLKLVMCRGHLSQPRSTTDYFDWHSPFLRRTVKELYWGYDNDPLLVELNKLLDFLKALVPALAPELPVIDTHFPGLEDNYTDINGPHFYGRYSNVYVQHTGCYT